MLVRTGLLVYMQLAGSGAAVRNAAVRRELEAWMQLLAVAVLVVQV